VNAVALHGPGIPINVRAPERFALHKLLVSRMRIATSRSQAKATKDLDQARALIAVLRHQRPGGKWTPHPSGQTTPQARRVHVHVRHDGGDVIPARISLAGKRRP
jgi:hypothetical protein